MKRKQIKKLVVIFAILCISIIFITKTSFADVGSFEDYSSGSSSSFSSSSSSYDYDSDGGSSGDGDFLGGLIFFVIIVIIIIISSKNNKGNGSGTGTSSNTQTKVVRNEPTTPETIKPEEEIVSAIQEHDELFNKQEILAWSSDLFVKLQNAWTQRNWETIRIFETNSLFEQHKNQLQGYIDNNQINVMDRIAVTKNKLYDYSISGDKEILVVRMEARMQDYIIDATTKNVIRGSKNIERYSTYLLTFERKLGIKTKPGTTVVNTTNCPNCGAPTQITSAGKCEYCGSVITTGEYNWCLSDLKRG